MSQLRLIFSAWMTDTPWLRICWPFCQDRPPPLYDNPQDFGPWGVFWGGGMVCGMEHGNLDCIRPCPVLRILQKCLLEFALSTTGFPAHCWNWVEQQSFIGECQDRKAGVWFFLAVSHPRNEKLSRNPQKSWSCHAWEPPGGILEFTKVGFGLPGGSLELTKSTLF